MAHPCTAAYQGMRDQIASVHARATRAVHTIEQAFALMVCLASPRVASPSPGTVSTSGIYRPTPVSTRELSEEQCKVKNRVCSSNPSVDVKLMNVS